MMPPAMTPFSIATSCARRAVQNQAMPAMASESNAIVSAIVLRSPPAPLRFAGCWPSNSLSVMRNAPFPAFRALSRHGPIGFKSEQILSAFAQNAPR